MKVVLSLFAFSLTLSASSIQLRQGGWDTGGPLTVSFSGQDDNSDGTIDSLELNAFSAEFRVAGGGTTAWSLPDIQDSGFFFASVNDYLIFASNSEYSLVNLSFDGEAIASVFDRNLFPVSSTIASPTEVPEPSGMLWVAVPFLYYLKRTQLRRNSS